MIIDITSKIIKNKTENQILESQQFVIDSLQNMLELAKKGYIVGFASTGFTSEGLVFIAVEPGSANTHEINSSIATLSNLFNGVVVARQQTMMDEMKNTRDIFILPKATDVK